MSASNALENEDTSRKEVLPTNHILSVMVCALSIPLSMSLWIVNMVYAKFASGDVYDEPIIINPTRWLSACAIVMAISIYGYKKKSLSVSGAFLAFFVGFIMTISSYCFFACLFTFFFSSSRATKFRSGIKRKFEENFKEGGQRNWVQVLCNGGMATQLSLLYLLDIGCSERPIDFAKDYRASWLAIGILGCIATCNGDTWASELGTVFGESQPFLITTRERVPKGTNGGITIVGTLFSALGGAVIGLANYLVIAYSVDSQVLAMSPPQWPLLIIGALGGFLGSMIDSFLGATLQFSGLNNKGQLVSQPSQAVKSISGRALLDNHSVNLISSVIMGLLLPTVANVIWISK